MTDIKTREAAAIAAALLLARLAHLRFDCDPSAPMLPFRNYLHASGARLLLVPSIERAGDDNAVIGAAVQRLGHDALVVRAAGRAAADIRCEVALATEQPICSAPLQLWLGAGGSVHLVAEQMDATSYELSAYGLRGRKSPPWTGGADREAGLLRGRLAFARVLEGC